MVVSPSALTDRQRDVGTCYIARFASRDDAYAAWAGDQWLNVKEPLTVEVMAAGLRGKGPSISSYFPDREGLTHIAALDFDTDDGLRQAYRVARALQERVGAWAYVEESRRGAHLWWPLGEQVAAWLVRKALFGALVAARLEPDPKIELRPKSPHAPGKNGYGTSLRMPMMPHPLTGQGYGLFFANGEPLPRKLDECLLAIDEHPDTPLDDLKALAKLAPLDPDDTDASLRPGRRSWQDKPRANHKTVTEVAYERWGAILRAGRANRCFAPSHDDRHPSLSVMADDERLVCKAPHCVLNNNEHGYSAYELARLEL